MRLAPGTRIGPFEVVSMLGSGAMGEVYRATDTNLARQVAIKVLHEAVASDVERLARFDREAKTLASLNHPNIATIHGVETAEGLRALVMELVQGRTRADRRIVGPSGIGATPGIAKQIGAALEAAHEKNVVHRDLKPANIKLTTEGTVKVLDFGIAKVLHETADRDPAQSPTVTAAGTRAGM